jgi:putative ATP-dependent DNA ligase
VDSLREAFERARGSGVVRPLDHEGLGYQRLDDDAAGLHRGTVLVEGRVVPFFPSIARVFALEAGIRHNLEGRFAVEEKIDGYNIRIVRAAGRLVAFTRGGWLCPFTTDRLPDLAELGPVFDEQPDAVICAEIAGPGNPYLDAFCPHVGEDVALFAFDLMHLDRREPAPIDQRDRLLDAHRVPRPPGFGLMALADLDRLRQVVIELDARGSEGVVLKPVAGGMRLKYVTPASDLALILRNTDRLAELPGEYFTGKLVRLVMAARELGLEDRLPEIEQRLGRALLGGFRAALEQLEDQGVISHTVTIRLRDPSVAERIIADLDHRSDLVQIREVEREQRGEHLHLTLKKTFQRSTSFLKTIGDGHPVVD